MKLLKFNHFGGALVTYLKKKKKMIKYIRKPPTLLSTRLPLVDTRTGQRLRTGHSRFRSSHMYNNLRLAYQHMWISGQDTEHRLLPNIYIKANLSAFIKNSGNKTVGTDERTKKHCNI